MHKTGSTSLQQFLVRNRAWVKEKGWIYPVAGCPPIAPGGQHNLVWQLIDYTKASNSNASGKFVSQDFNGYWEIIAKEQRNKTSGWDDFFMEVSGCDENILISSENFSLPYFQPSLLYKKLREYDVKIILCIRQKQDWQRSMYFQEVKNGNYHGAFNSFVKDNKIIEWSDFDFLINKYKKVFGENNVDILSLDDIDQSSNLIIEFLERIGIVADRKMIQNDIRVNISPSEKMINLMRILNFSLLRSTSSRRKIRVVNLYRRYLRNGGLIDRLVQRVPNLLP